MSSSVVTSSAARSELPQSHLLRSTEAKAACLIGFGFVLWLAVAALTRPGVPLDMAEMIGWGNQWQWGYHKHPPLPCWISEAIWSHTASTTAIYACSQLFTVVSLVCVFLVARRWLSAGHALIAVAALQASYYTHYTTLDLNHTITCRVFWSVAVLAFLRAVELERKQVTGDGSSGRWLDFRKGSRLRTHLWWTLCGVALGLGALSKYYIAILAGCFALVPLLLPAYRPLLKRVGPWWMVMVAGVIVAPHIVWLVENHFLPLTYAMHRGSVEQSSITDHLVNPFVFVLKQAGVWLVLLALLRFLLRGPSRSASAGHDSSTARTAPRSVSTEDRWLLTIVLVGPVIGFLLASALTGAALRSMWGGPLWTFFPVWAMLVSMPLIDRLMERRALVTGLIVCSLMAAVSAGVNVGGPYFTSGVSRHHWPTHSLATAVQSAWRDHADGPLAIVGGPYFHSCLVNMHHPDRPAVYYEARPEWAPWTSDDAMRRLGGVLVWEIEQDDSGAGTPKLPEDWSERFPEAIVCSVSQIPAMTDASIPPVRYGIAVVPPHQRLASDEPTAEPSLR